MFTCAGLTLQQQYPTGGQRRGKNEFINSTFHQLDVPSVCVRILQNTSTSSEFISGKNQVTAQSRHSETFYKELAQTDKRSYDTGYSKRLQNPFYFAAKAIKATKFLSINQRSIRPCGSGGPGHLKKDAMVVSDPKEDQFLSLLFLVKKKEGRNHPAINLKDLNSNIPYQHFKMEGLLLLKEMLLPGDKMCKIDLKDAYFAIPLSVKSRKYVRFQWKGFLYEFFLPLLRAFSSSSLSLEETQCKNNNLPRRHATNGIFIRGLVDGKRYTDIHTSTLRVSDQYQKVLPRAKIDFRICRGDS